MKGINSRVNILIIGDLMLDHYIYGNCSRISPEAPVQVVEVKKEEYTLGGAGNVLKNLKAFNCKADIISICGNDEQALILKEQIKAAGVGIDGVFSDKERCTTVKSRVLVSKHQLIRLDREVTTALNAEVSARLLHQIERIVADYDLVLISDYNKGLLTENILERIFTLCSAAGIKTVVDPKGADYSKYKGANLIKPNKKEAAIASGIEITDKETLLQACDKIKDITGCDDVIVTMSEDGIAMYSNGQLNIIPTKAIGVIDVTGAGDTVLAALGLALASGNTLSDACDFANHAAAVVVSKVGSATASLDEIKQKYST